MLDVCLLGCGGTMPLPNRWLTSLWLRFKGHMVLVDCGEGTQIALKEAGISSHDIDVILITHFHGDHIYGLPGILMSMGTNGRVEPVTIIGPKRIGTIVSQLCVAAGIPFELQFIELSEESQEMEILPGLFVQPFPVVHRIPCYGYSFRIPRAGRFDADKARALNIPLPLWGKLQKGESVEGFTPDMVLGPERTGLKVTYSTDTRPCEALKSAVQDSDLCILEGMYGDPGRQYSAELKRHMMFQEAAEIAKEADAKALWLTHFSTSEVNPQEWLPLAQSIFMNTELGENGKKISLKFPEEKGSA